ncbi:MAG: SRPBCC domain-containing protein [Gammaproteobacteria bacterium]|nr:SRPBCC domain-containing protein [Gammaproteobacteria bacterium]
MTTFKTSRTFLTSPAALFAAIQDPTCLATWWGPAGFSNRFSVFEFKPGGQWVFTMIGPDGKTYPNEAVFLSIEPDRQVVIQHVCQPHFQLTITFEATAAGTKLHWEQIFEDDKIAEQVRHIVGPANEQNLVRLDQALRLRNEKNAVDE